VAAFVSILWAVGLLWFLAALPGPAALAVHTDGIVALTGDDGRLSRGFAALRAHAARRMLISGVGAATTPGGIALKDHVPRALLRCCVDLGHEAVDTRSNAQEAAHWVLVHRVRSVRLVTSDYHMRRAQLELAAELGPDLTILPDAVPGRTSLGLLAREYTKWLWRTAVRDLARD